MKLENLCKIKHGYAFNGKHIVKDHSTQYILVTPGNFNIGGGFKSEKCKYFSENGEIPKDYILHEDDLIITMTDLSVKSDTLGYSALVPYDQYHIYLHNQRIGLVYDIDESKVLKKYLYWFMRTKKYHQKVVSSQSGTAIHHTSPNRILDIDIELPSIDVQCKIIKVLEDIDNKIKLNNKINDNLFNLINLNYNKYLNEVSELENIEEISVKEIFDFESGIEPGSKNYLEKEGKDTIKFYRVGDMGSECKTFIKKDLANNKIINEDDIVVSFDATIGRIGYGLNGSFSTGMKKINVNNKYKNIIDNSVVFAYFNNIDTQNKILENAKGTTILHAGSAINFLNFKYNEELLIKYGKIISIFFQKMKQIKKENENLSNLRDTLLPRLMNGEIDLENIEI